jgi:hypothetical protein
MKKILSFAALFTSLFFLFPSSAQAALTYNNGTYTNVCGSGLAADSHACNGSCNPANGSCSAFGNTVVKFTCDGRQTECKNNETMFSNYQSIGAVSCGKTVGIAVYNKNCRADGGWSCGEGDMKDYIVWYSGDCGTNQTPTNTNSVSESKCESLQVIGGQDGRVPAKVTLRARGSDPRGSIQRYKYYFGDGQQMESDQLEVSHDYLVSGNFVARVDVRDSQGNWRSSSSCETTVRVSGVALESHKSDCSDVHITANNGGRAPSTVTFDISGYDNKGNIQAYKMDFGNGVIKESNGRTFEQLYQNSGTYTVKAYVKDSEGSWVGGTESCSRTLTLSSQTAMTTQPKTGTPMFLPILGLVTGAAGLSLQLMKRRIVR